MVGFDTWGSSNSTVFIIKNLTNKTIDVFKARIKSGETFNLMSLNYVSEADIRNSALKGNLKSKIESGNISIVESNIDLTQYDPLQKEILEVAGVTTGTTPSGGGGFYQTVQNDGEPVTQEEVLNFQGSGVTVTSEDGVTNVTVSGGENVFASDETFNIYANYPDATHTPLNEGATYSFSFSVNNDEGYAAGIQSSNAASLSGENHKILGAPYSVIAGGREQTIDYPNTESSGANFIGGGANNYIRGEFNTISGGADHTITGEEGTVANGSTISGGQNNSIATHYSAIAGGSDNNIENNNFYSFIGGGDNNYIYNNINEGSGTNVITGGSNNAISGGNNVIGGGSGNQIVNEGASYYYSSIVGGSDNKTYSNYSSVVGGTGNNVSAFASAVVGGNNNSIYDFSGEDSAYSFIGAGSGNQIRGGFCGIVSGTNNQIIDSNPTVGHSYNFIGAGLNGLIKGFGSGIICGQNNQILETNKSAILSGSSHYILGGYENSAILAGDTNQINSSNSIVTGSSAIAKLQSGFTLASGNYPDVSRGCCQNTKLVLRGRTPGVDANEEVVLGFGGVDNEVQQQTIPAVFGSSYILSLDYVFRTTDGGSGAGKLLGCAQNLNDTINVTSNFEVISTVGIGMVTHPVFSMDTSGVSFIIKAATGVDITSQMSIAVTMELTEVNIPTP